MEIMLSPTHSDLMQREEVNMEAINNTTTENTNKRKLTQTKLNFTKKQKTFNNNNNETNVASNLLDNIIQGTIRRGGAYKRRKPPLGTKTNPFTVVPRKKKDRQEGYYIPDDDILRFWNYTLQIMYLLCNQCEYKTNDKTKLKRHKASIHGIDVIWHPCDEEGCNFKCKEKKYLKRHKAGVHDIDVTWNYCDIEGCNFKCKQKGDLKGHKAYVHDIDVTWHCCDVEGCTKRYKRLCELARHKQSSHHIDVRWYYCDIKGCNYKTAWKYTCLKTHKSIKHNIDVTWHYCVEGCQSKFRTARELKSHKARKHDIDVTWYYCDVEGCNRKFKDNWDLKRHKAQAHDIDVIWHLCDVEGCNRKFRTRYEIKRHKSRKHDIDVTWHYCDVEGCNWKFKENGNLKRHKRNIHDIGNLECEICYESCGKVVSHEFTYGQSTSTGTIDICRQCCRDYGLKKDRIEHRYMEILDEYIDFTSHDDQMVKGEACYRYRPDRLYLDVNRRVYIHIEIDENEHPPGSYTCEEQRISNIYDEFANDVPDHYVVIRFNPDEYDKNDEDREEVFEERARHLAEIIQYVRENPPPEKVSIIYMYYSENNPQITQNFPKYFIDDENNISW